MRFIRFIRHLVSYFLLPATISKANKITKVIDRLQKEVSRNRREYRIHRNEIRSLIESMQSKAEEVERLLDKREDVEKRLREEIQRLKVEKTIAEETTIPGLRDACAELQETLRANIAVQTSARARSTIQQQGTNP